MNTKPATNNLKKDTKISYTDRNETKKHTSTILSELKQKNGSTIRIVIDKRTCIELPAHLTQAEIDERIAVYVRSHAPIK